MKEWLKGKKTYIVMILGVLINGLISMGVIDASVREVANSILAFLGLGTLRAGVKKSEK